MLKITDVKLSKNTVATGEKFTISVQIQETVDYPYDYPYDYPISYTGTAKQYLLSCQRFLECLQCR